MRTVLLLLLLLRLTSAIPFKKSVSVGREVLRGWRNHPTVAMLATVDVDSSRIPR